MPAPRRTPKRTRARRPRPIPKPAIAQLRPSRIAGEVVPTEPASRPDPVAEDTDPASEPEAATAAVETDPAPVAEAPGSGEAESVPAEVATDEPSPEPQQTVAEVSAEPQEDVADPAAPANQEQDADQAVAAGAPSPTPEAEDEAGTEPSFDIVRVGGDGRAVIAGRAAPGAEVEVRSGGQVLDRVRATRRGEWVAIPAKPLAPGDQELVAVATQGGTAVESEQVVVVAVPTPAAPQRPAVAAEQAMAVLLPRDGAGSGRVLQAPGRLSAEGTLALMTVSYDESGKVLLSGEAPPGVPVRIYVDNRPAAVVVGDAKGGWSSGLDENLAPGTYTLRLDQLDADGQTVARIETPFTRVSEPPVEGDLKVDYVVVQPGNSLWRIARRLYGKGMNYVHIYGANQPQIRDPDLIYPGQVFEVPVGLSSSG